MRAFSTLFATTLLTLCVGLQVLEATGRWDRTIEDTGDEAIVVTVVLCVGSALLAARTARHQFLPAPTPFGIVIAAAAASRPLGLPPFAFAFDTSPPVGLRI